MKHVLLLLLLVGISQSLFAWVADYAPDFKRIPIPSQELDESEITRFVDTSQYMPCVGKYIYTADLNDDGKKDYVIYIGSGGCGLAAQFGWVYFILSTPTGSKTTKLDCMAFESEDLIRHHGKKYFIRTTFQSNSAIDGHNYWFYQVYSFDKYGHFFNCTIGKTLPFLTRHK